MGSSANFQIFTLFFSVPKPLVTEDGVIVSVGDVAVLTCNVSGTPDGTTVIIQWKRAGDVDTIPGANSTTYHVSSSANMSDAGIYTCEVTVHDKSNRPLVIPAFASANITLIIIHKKGIHSIYMYFECIHVCCKFQQA